MHPFTLYNLKPPFPLLNSLPNSVYLLYIIIKVCLFKVALSLAGAIIVILIFQPIAELNLPNGV